MSELITRGTLEIWATPNVSTAHPDTHVCFDPGSSEVWSRGKGVGLQSLASGLFEVIEHAVAAGQLRESTVERGAHVSDLAGRHIARDGLLKYFAKSRSECPDEAFPAVEFQRWPEADGQVLYPSRLVETATQYPQAEVYDLFRTSSGYAAGSTIAEAVLHALNEIIERDALSLYYVRRLQGTSSARAATLPVGLDDLRRSIASTPGVEAWPKVHILQSLAGTVAVAECGLQDGYRRLDIGCGASTDPGYAVERALLELMQERLATTLASDPAPRDAIERPLTQLASYPNLQAIAAATDFPDQAGTLVVDPEPAGTVEDMLAMLSSELEAAGLEVLWREIPTVLSGVHVVQVRVPGAEAFHLVRAGIPMEPMGRLRTPEIVRMCRQRA